MKLLSFRIQKYKCVQDSGWVEVSPLTVMVGKNEAGKTSILKALHKFHPFNPEPYSIEREWPRGQRRDRDETFPVCMAKFKLTPDEIEELSQLTEKEVPHEIEITKDYGGRFEIPLLSDLFATTLHPNDIDAVCRTLPKPNQEHVGEAFLKKANDCLSSITRLVHEGRFSEITPLQTQHSHELNESLTPGNPHPYYTYEQEFMNAYIPKLAEVSQKLSKIPSVRAQAHELIINCLPTFIYRTDLTSQEGAASRFNISLTKQRLIFVVA
jgi:hypothetical protein